MSLAIALRASLCAAAVLAGPLPADAARPFKDKPLVVEMFAPENGANVGIGGRGWFVDLAIIYDVPLEQSGFTVNENGKPGFQLTGPDAAADGAFGAGVHNNVNPMPGTFSLGADDRLPGLIVLLSTTTVGVGACHNLANLFNLTGVTDQKDNALELWDTWIVGAPNFGVDTRSRIFVAVAKDLDGDGIYNDAPDVLPDANGDGKCNAADLTAFGVDSNIATATFYINP